MVEGGRGGGGEGGEGEGCEVEWCEHCGGSLGDFARWEDVSWVMWRVWSWRVHLGLIPAHARCSKVSLHCNHLGTQID